MKYMGSKRAMVKHILPTMLAARKPGQPWIEPFVGGGNMIEHVENPRWGNDISENQLALLVAARDGWVPPDYVSEAQYNHVRNNQHLYHPAVVGFVSVQCSFGATYWGSYARPPNGTNCAGGPSRSVVKQGKKMAGVHFTCMSYSDMPISAAMPSLIYCDPPYAGTVGYSDKSFNSLQFWKWCRDRVAEGHTVFVSEYNAPPDVREVLRIEHSTRVNKGNATKRVEKLFQVVA